ncbi:hypothetical protein AB0B54_32575 [Microbispora bryophytorum]|uniref:hypothetical protein n=1 Tax=Microbispora bryophytorum TaxID=1460882 RepID=UPI00340F64ED
MSACCHEYASGTFTYEVDGKTITWFDPMNPSSSRAAILTTWSRRYATSGWTLIALSKAQTSISDPQLVLLGEQDHRQVFLLVEPRGFEPLTSCLQIGLLFRGNGRDLGGRQSTSDRD